jgi:L-arabinose isomerase
MKAYPDLELWFLTGSQHLYGEETLKQVAAHSQEMAGHMNEAAQIPARVVYKPVLKTPAEITSVMEEANHAPNCIGVITWMHTFSPAKMWINGLTLLKKPLLHLHTQYEVDLPWSEIDMDFMNLNQSAHGDREFGFMCSRLRLERKVVTGHWRDGERLERIGAWARAAAGLHEARRLKVARLGDNMREVAVTEGDKVAAQIAFGYSVNGFGVGDVVERVRAVRDADVERLLGEYREKYEIAPAVLSDAGKMNAIRTSARIELGIRAFLEQGGFMAFTTTFEDLHGLEQLPGLASQRLMGDGYGFGAEGDWKTAALVRIMKVMARGLPGGTSFMEDYTYHLNAAGPKVLGAHMLEVCPSIASGKPALDVQKLGIGGKDDPPRLVFTAPPGAALNASLIDMGDRFRLLVNEVTTVAPDAPLPKLPVARAVWVPKPDLERAATGWILSGGAHHTGYSQAVTTEMLEDYADMAGIELVVLDAKTEIRSLKQELRQNDLYYKLARGVGMR